VDCGIFEKGSRKEEFIVCVADGGSKNDTPPLSESFSRQIAKFRHIIGPRHGKSAAVWLGMLNTTGKYVISINSNVATPNYRNGKAVQGSCRRQKFNGYAFDFEILLLASALVPN
jgi:hypothetical protein